MKNIASICLLLCLHMASQAAEPLKIVCTTPDLADLVKQVGGDAVTVESLARPGDNPHFVSVRPSFIRKVASADAFVVIGMDLEVGWAPALTRSARNNKLRPGQNGYIDCSKAITALEVPKAGTDRSAGDVHPHGNPHYLLSPICGMQVIHLLGERLAQLDPDRAKQYKEQAAAAQQALGQLLYGKELVAAFKLDELIAWHLQGDLEEKIGEHSLGGWMQEMSELKNASFIDDHKQWPYLAQCFRFKIISHLEPKAGVPPSSSHLQKVIALCKQSDVKGVITSPWFDPRHAKLVSEAAGIPILALAHQAGALQGTERYEELCAFNVAALKAISKSQ